MRKLLFLFAGLLFTAAATGQNKNFLDQPYLETSASADTLVIPDRIYLGILLKESDTRGRTTVEELEQQMSARLKAIGVDTQKQLAVASLSSDFRRYFLRGQEVEKDKSFELVVYDAQMAGRVLFELEKLGIANVSLNRTEYSKLESLQMALKTAAVRKAREQGRMMSEALGQGLGRAIYISDSGYNVYPMLRGKAAGVQMSAMQEADAYQPVDSDFQKTRVEVSVQVKFILE
ncbi:MULTISPECIES: SIMPL domain-containing protein [unclassified Robiginitalea]|uniref:SIMPL domain-containing protein n=1 Tax=Robiginitalea TaxID=252306 RepID=UPI00234A1447|nr:MULTISPECIES: SIMPL domain-containing protein [unclassified Robiginitalea]MDC6354541.1 SIMPL domain-containing protein [Robiginitalea sp. PM2]MDC6374777.1 SIMPL domain-containing protein [Robiginitalea sp. SP8]